MIYRNQYGTCYSFFSDINNIQAKRAIVPAICSYKILSPTIYIQVLCFVYIYRNNKELVFKEAYNTKVKEGDDFPIRWMYSEEMYMVRVKDGESCL